MFSLLVNCWRRFFGRYEIVDPRPIAKESPYTFFLPSAVDLARLEPGHVAKLMFCGLPEQNVERMWVRIESKEPEGWTGKLDNVPFDMPQLRLGDAIRFHPWQIIQTSADETGDQPDHREYWDRCFVDPLILSGDGKVHYLERVEPEGMEEGRKYPDSGWRIYGREIELGEDGPDVEFEMEYLALGVVLNKDDSWLDLIDEPVGSEFRRDFQTGRYNSVA